MASTYPGSLDSFDTITSDKKTSDSVGGRTHRDMHNDLGDAIEAVQAELGTDPAGSDATVKARLTAIEAGTNLGSGSVSTAKLADGAVTAPKLATQPGNVLPLAHAAASDAAQFELAGVGSIDATGGSDGGPCISWAGNDSYAQFESKNKISVDPSTTYTISVAVKMTTGTSIRIGVPGYDGGGSYVAEAGGTPMSSVTPANNTWTTLTHTFTTQSTVSQIRIDLNTSPALATGNTLRADRYGLWKGAGGLWALPGAVIVGQSPILTSPDGTQYVLAVDNSGVLSAEEL